MPNGKNMLDDMVFHRELEAMGDDIPKLVKFMAWRQFEMVKQIDGIAQLCPVHHKRIRVLENRDKKWTGTIGGVGGLIGVAIASAFDYILRR